MWNHTTESRHLWHSCRFHERKCTKLKVMSDIHQNYDGKQTLPVSYSSLHGRVCHPQRRLHSPIRHFISFLVLAEVTVRVPTNEEFADSACEFNSKTGLKGLNWFWMFYWRQWQRRTQNSKRSPVEKRLCNYNFSSPSIWTTTETEERLLVTVDL